MQVPKAPRTPKSTLHTTPSFYTRALHAPLYNTPADFTLTAFDRANAERELGRTISDELRLLAN